MASTVEIDAGVEAVLLRETEPGNVFAYSTTVEFAMSAEKYIVI